MAARKRNFADSDIFLGTAGWTLPRDVRGEFPEVGSQLDRYAHELNAVEINTSFYRPHRETTYAKWRASVPEDFRFSVKVPKTITHERHLVNTEDLLDPFLAQVSHLEDRLGCLLVQLPPSLEFDAGVAKRFFRRVGKQTLASIVCEPRHATWFTKEADALLKEHRVARVAADPAKVPAAAKPGGWKGIFYYRLHGSPRTYYSSYSDEYLQELATVLNRARSAGKQVWCIFDNTALGAAMQNALTLGRLLRSASG